MALVWAEPFDQYGGNAALIPSFGYSYCSIGLSAAGIGRTGSYAGAWGAGSASYLQRSLDNAEPIVGQGAAIKVITPEAGQSSNSSGMHFQSAGSVAEFDAIFMADLSIGIYDRTGTLTGQSAPNKLIVNDYVWMEVKGIANTAGPNTGTVEVRIQGITVLIINGINLPNNFAQVQIGGGFNSWSYYGDDWIVWDGTGLYNNDFLGDRALFASFPNANVAGHQSFVPSAGSAFNCVNQIPPVDTTFIEGGAAGDISEFAKGAIGIASNDIAAVVVIGRLFKSDAGSATGRLGINSNGNVLNGPSIPPGTGGAYFRNIVERDPNGNIAWSKAAADAANIRITRDA